jgi:type II secretory pathway component HofQ
MSDALLITAVIGFASLVVLLPKLLLAARDAQRRRLQLEQLPVTERIAQIRQDAELVARQFERMLGKWSVERPEAAAWMPPVLEPYRRQATVASASEPSALEASRLADETAEDFRQRPVKESCRSRRHGCSRS